MRTRRKSISAGFTLPELIVATIVGISVVVVFFLILRNSLLFVALNKQDMSVLQNVRDMKIKIADSFAHDKIELRYSTGSISKAHSGVYSFKDVYLTDTGTRLFDMAAFEYTDYSYSGGQTLSQTGMFAIGIIDKDTEKLLDTNSRTDGFFAMKYLTGSENIYSYIRWNTGSIKTFDDYVNKNVNISGFTFDFIPTGSSGSSNDGILRLNFSFDNDLNGNYRKSAVYDENYFSGSTFFVKRIGIKKVD